MKHRLKTSSLVALNVLLLGVFGLICTVDSSEAQSTRGHRYIAIDGKVNGLSSGVVYILDTTQQELVAVTWDHNENRLTPLGYRPIASDSSSALRNN